MGFVKRRKGEERKGGSGLLIDSAEKPLSGFFSFVQLRSLADEPEFVACIDFPFHHFPWLNINGSSEREWQVHITL
jgi:hypothetical protein